MRILDSVWGCLNAASSDGGRMALGHWIEKIKEDRRDRKMLYLKPLSLEDGRAYYELLQRIGADENGYVNRVHGMPYTDFPRWLARAVDRSLGIGLPTWMVPEANYWLMDGETPVGQGRIRSYLTDALRVSGGHIAYAVDPLRRGQGYGKSLLRFLLEEARHEGITEELLVTVNPDNLPSRRVAESCGGILRQETAEHIYYAFPFRPEGGES